VSESTYRISVEDGDLLREQVVEGLNVFNEAAAGPYNIQHVHLAIRGDDGSLAAGLVGLCYWNMLHVDLLWVAPTHRLSGCGAALLRRAEQIATEHGCDVVYLSTYAFQAPGFYQKQGYEAFGTLQDAPQGFSFQWFSKRLPRVDLARPPGD